MVLCVLEDGSIKRSKCSEFQRSAKRYLGGEVQGRNTFREVWLVAWWRSSALSSPVPFNQFVEVKPDLVLFLVK